MSATEQDLSSALATGATCMFLSPHLDDAAFSCGALLSWLSGRLRVLVVTFFTESEPPPHTRAARSFLRQCSVEDAPLLYRRRRSEDLEAVCDLGFEVVHLGQRDALFRMRAAPRFVPSVARAALPELFCRYPTYRFDIAKGRVSRGDARLIDELRGQVADVAGEVAPALVFSPLGIGRHVDHLVTRAVGEEFGSRTVFYADAPYCYSSPPDAAFVERHGLRPWSFEGDLEAKRRLMARYETQVDAVFPRGVPAVPDHYYVSRS
jgi:LmbE family N-acetylglucosaminyl deacetylase